MQKHDAQKIIQQKKLHRLLRNIYRHYSEYREFFEREGYDVIEAHGVTISFLDLKRGINELSDRKREAFWLYAVEGLYQREVAERMNIETVTVGQYVDAACTQLAQTYFADLLESHTLDKIELVDHGDD